MGKAICTIVGCGSNGQSAYDSIDRDSEVILCNGAVRLLNWYRFADVKWFIADNLVVDLPFFETFYMGYDIPIYGSGQVAKRIMVQHEFQENPAFMHGDSDLVEGVLRSGGSVVAQAMQYVYYKDKRSVLCGVDMEGRTSLSHGDENVYPEGHWSHRRNVINQLIGKYMKDTTTLSETALMLGRLPYESKTYLANIGGS